MRERKRGGVVVDRVGVALSVGEVAPEPGSHGVGEHDLLHARVFVRSLEDAQCNSAPTSRAFEHIADVQGPLLLLPRTAYYRELAATLYDLTARIVRATPDREGWVVVVQRRGDTAGRVVLEMIDGDKREVEAAMARPRSLAGAWYRMRKHVIE